MSVFRITCVCLGNICRSPMAEAVLRQRIDGAGLSAAVVVDSAGTDGWHVGEDADARARAILTAAGYDLEHAGRQITAAWFDTDHPNRADLVLTMDTGNYRAVRSLAPEGAARDRVRMLRSFDPALAGVPDGDPRLDVPDPYFGGPEGFVEVLAMIEAAVDGLVDDLPALIAQ